MNVWIAGVRYFPLIGGVESVMFYTSKALSELGHESHIINFCDPPETPRKEYATVHYLPLKSLRGTRLYYIYKEKCKKRVKEFIKSLPKDQMPDLIVACDETTASFFPEYGLKAPVIYHPGICLKSFYRYYPHKNGKGIKDYINRKNEELHVHYQSSAVKRCERVVVLGNSMCNQIIEQYAISPSRVVTSYPGPSVEIAPTHKKPIPRGRNLVFVGRLYPEKKVDLLVETMNLLDDVKLTIVGDGRERSRIEKEISNFGLNDRVTMVGETYDVRQYIDNADFLIIPSKYEPFGLVVLEAFSRGVPVIGFKTIPEQSCTAMEELVNDGVTGFLCKDFSAQALGDTISYALSMSDEEYETMRKACFNQVLDKYNWNAFTRDILDSGTRNG